ncbi:hypothetical protein KIW84_045309 [Lathyrus oleraceus]|uniref:Retroviral polymerase SH3-like domain-containing protein n=1 Tax=Pisum sativum TaxID=3888 RepID=A0A9D4XKU4_PEA|nr:hypothetical protein KIW84_045309 [Pisum sativum]
MTRSMLKEKKGPHTLWGEVVATIAYVLNRYAKRRKLDDRRRVMFLVGHHSTYAYKLYCPVTNKVEFNKDVIMKEIKAWDWNKSQSNSSAVLILELTSEGDSASKDESESEGDSDAEVESESESDYEGESDSDPDSDDDPDSGGYHALEGSPTFDIVPTSEEDFEQVQRP